MSEKKLKERAFYSLLTLFLLPWEKKNSDRTFLRTQSISSYLPFSLRRRGLESTELE